MLELKIFSYYWVTTITPLEAVICFTGESVGTQSSQPLREA